MKARSTPWPTMRRPRPGTRREGEEATYAVALVVLALMLADVVLGIVTGRCPHPWGL